jgi:hypothetical protein
VSHRKNSKKLTGIIAILFLIPPLLLFVGYALTGIGGGYMSPVEKQETLLEHLPSWSQNYSVLVIVSIIFCFISLILASGSYKKKSLSSRIKMLVVILLSIFFILFDISQLV